MTAKLRIFAALAAAALLQSAALAKIVWDRDRLIRNGREIVMRVVPVDPRDLVRGDYVQLGFGLSPLYTAKLKLSADMAAIAPGDRVYVTLHPDSDKNWSVTAVSISYPVEVASEDAVLQGRLENIWQDGSDNAPKSLVFDVRYGIESYFVPEGTGPELEAAVRDKTVEALVAVGRDGTAALKGLVIGGERHEDPPLF